MSRASKSSSVSRNSFEEILRKGGPFFRVQERVADWSANATADELIAALRDVDEWPKLNDELSSRITDRLLNRLGQLDGAAAVELATLLLPLESSGENYVQTAYESWLAEEPAAAVEHIFKQRTEETDANRDFLTRMLAQLGESDPEYADVVAETMAWSGNQFFASVAETRRAEVFESALEGRASIEFLNEWIAAGRFSPGEITEMRQRLVRWVVTNEQDPQQLAQLMDQGFPISESLRWEVMRVLGKSDVTRATQFLASQTNPEKRAEELVNLLDVQSENTAQAASLQGQTTSWLVSTYQGADRQTLLQEASRKLMESDLGLAWRAASAMTENDLKFASTYAVGFDWLAKDPQVARAQLPPGMVERYDLIMQLYNSATTGFPPDVKLNLSFTR